VVSASRGWVAVGLGLMVAAAGSEPLSGAVRQTSGSIIEAPLKALSSGVKTGAEMVSGAFSPPVQEANDPTSLAVKSKPTPELYLAMARLAEQSGRFEEADQHYRQALKSAPKDLSVLIGYARMKDRQDRLEEAVELYQQAAKAHPDNAVVYNDLGLCLARRKQMPEAVAALERATQLDARQLLYRNNVATVLVELGDVDAAYTHLAAVHPPAVAYYNVGYLLHKKGQNQAAASLFAQALKVDPSLEPARLWLNRLNAAPQVAGAPFEGRAMGGGRLEDPTVEAPDLRAVRRQSVVPIRRMPAEYSPHADEPRPIPPLDSGPMPRLTSPQATAPTSPGPTIRQLPPVYESSRRQGRVIPQSWEDAPLPTPKGPAGEVELTDQTSLPGRENSPPAQLPEETIDEAAPLP
jgi:tetratricopeptide (TPR) repeat protein